MSGITFTSTLTVQLIESDVRPDNMIHGHASFAVTAPRSAWLAHGSDGFEIQAGEHGSAPEFYLPDPPLTLVQQFALRGALEISADAAWSAFEALMEAGVAEEVAELVLPGHHMSVRRVRASGLTLAGFVKQHRHYTPGGEVAVIARGYARHLAEVAPEFLPRIGN